MCRAAGRKVNVNGSVRRQQGSSRHRCHACWAGLQRGTPHRAQCKVARLQIAYHQRNTTEPCYRAQG